MARISIKKNFVDGDKLFAQQLNNNFETIEKAVNDGNKIVWQDGTEVTFKRYVTSDIDSLPISDGAIIYDTEKGRHYIDYQGKRIQVGSAGKEVVIKYVPKFLFSVLANLPKIKKQGKRDVILFSRFTLSHDLVGKDVVGEGSFKEYIKKSPPRCGAAEILFVDELCLCTEIFVRRNFESFLESCIDILHCNLLRCIEGILRNVIRALAV